MLFIRAAIPLLLLSIAPSFAAIKLAPVFTNDMVLQRDINSPVWGTATPGEKVKVSLLDQEHVVVADAKGDWLVRLQPLPARTTPFPITITAASETITLDNVLVGDVWLCAGQSNMARVASVTIAKINDTDLDYPLIRGFQVYRQVTMEPQKNARGKWRVCTPQNAPTITGVGFYFAREIFKKTGVPIGLLESNLGATNIEAWMTEEALASRPEIKPFLDEWRAALAADPALQKKFHSDIAAWAEKDAAGKQKYESDVDQWEKAKQQATVARQPAPAAPSVPVGSPLVLPTQLRRYYDCFYDAVAGKYVFQLRAAMATGCFNGMIAPVLPYGIRGVLWYQGENNVNRPEMYQHQFAALIEDWRKRWGLGDIPFLFVQLGRYLAPQTMPMESERGRRPWAEIREAQLLGGLSQPHTAMASAIDLGNVEDIHAPEKDIIGQRLAACALAMVYGEKREYSGPLYDSMNVEGNSIRLKFRHADGLVAKDGILKGFAIAGEDRKFVWADATLDGDTVLLASSEVPAPRFACYGWATNPIISLYNSAGFPASSFRTETGSLAEPLNIRSKP